MFCCCIKCTGHTVLAFTENSFRKVELVFFVNSSTARVRFSSGYLCLCIRVVAKNICHKCELLAFLQHTHIDKEKLKRAHRTSRHKRNKFFFLYLLDFCAVAFLHANKKHRTKKKKRHGV
eukprot:GEMP01061736.1.p1 GENE.GEMP01061736.1~~GEMP01061736.1.p1  ORF type:complete len:120 (+),score=10.24 GEMP01061736.1:581-940(+)